MALKKVKVKLYALSTCSHCMRTKKFFTDCEIVVDTVDVDLLSGGERERILDEVRRLNPECTFPTIVIGDKTIVGFNETKLREALGI